MAIVTVRRAMTPAQIGTSVVPDTDGWTLSEGGVLVAAKPAQSEALSLAETQTVTPSGATPWLLEDFSTYTSTANMLSDPRGIYSTGEDVNTANMVLDTTTGYGASAKSLRFDYPSRPAPGGCGDNTIGRNLVLPGGTSVPELWAEWICKFSSTWTNAEGCVGVNADFKMVFGRVLTSGRFNVMVGTYNAEYTVGYPAHEDDFEGHALTTEWDGNWHTWRWHMKVGSSGACKVWFDGTVVKDYGVASMATNQIYGFAVGRNINQGPAVAQSLWWGKISLYDTDPGWT